VDGTFADQTVSREYVEGLPGLELSYRLCPPDHRQHAKTFAFASRFLAAHKRRAIWAVYAFCRTADDIVDHASPAQERLGGSTTGATACLRAYERRATDPVMVAFADAAHRYAIPCSRRWTSCAEQPATSASSAMRRTTDLLEYCYLVASTVGLMISPILGYEDGALEYGIALGRAMQMTNILRDVGEDSRLGRVYLPAEELRRFDYPESSLLAGTIEPRFIELMRFQIARVRALYDEAAPGIELLSPDSAAWTVRLALVLLSPDLDEIERKWIRRFFAPCVRYRCAPSC